MSEQDPRYSMVIEWSNEDHTYIVSFLEWGVNTHTHGDTYEEAVRSGQEVLADLIALWRDLTRPLPEPRVFATTA
ncbi:MAG: type II toxin-antitoxin system HicB family antitoxin [Ktedonobacterales bacterium]